MFVGIDLGSRTIKVALLRGDKFSDLQVEESGFDPRTQATRLLAGMNLAADAEIVATGYGRNLAKEHFAQRAITEIKAHALGARYFFPACRTVLDVGGQDAKVISLAPNGKVLDFQMNDKCAAGTGRFLEIMATSLGFSLDRFGEAALAALAHDDDLRINSMCTVFAESEVINLKNQGRNPALIALAVHRSVVERLLAMLGRVGLGRDGIMPGHGGELVFTGGVAKNRCIVRLLEESLCLEIKSPPQPELTGAVGAALHAAKT